jgi:hypothetical protein
MNVKKRVVIFSIETGTPAGIYDKQHVENELSQYGFKSVLGSYNGVQENSYVVDASTDNALNDVLELAVNYNQESILIVDENRIASLYFIKTGLTTKLGNFTSISALEASKLDNWTLDGTDYYSVI